MSVAVAECIDHTVHEETTTLVLENGTHAPMEKSYSVAMLAIGSIQIPKTVRAVSEHLDWLTDSIRTLGLLHPITVKRVSPSSYELLSGHNRLEAVKKLDWETIPANILDYAENDTLKHPLSIADENLCRDDLTDLEFAEALGHAKELYEKLYPDTKHNATKKKKSAGKRQGSMTSSDPKNGSEPTIRPAFLDHESSILGRSRSSLGNYCFIYKNLKKAARDLIRNHKVADSYSELYTLAQEKADQLDLANILQAYPDYKVLHAKRYLAKQRGGAKKDAPGSATTAHGHQSTQRSDHSEVLGVSIVDQPSPAHNTLSDTTASDGHKTQERTHASEEGGSEEALVGVEKVRDKAGMRYQAVIPAHGGHPELRLPAVQSAAAAAYIYKRATRTWHTSPVTEVQLNVKLLGRLFDEFVHGVVKYVENNSIVRKK